MCWPIALIIRAVQGKKLIDTETLTNENESKALISIKNLTPIVTPLCSTFDSTEDTKNYCTRAKLRLYVLLFLSILSNTMAISWLFIINDKKCHSFFGTDSFFGLPISALLRCHRTRTNDVGLSLGTVGAVFLAATIYVRHPISDRYPYFPICWPFSSNSENIWNVGLRVRNIVLVIIGWIACINLILLIVYLREGHFTYVQICFGCFIGYQAMHNYYGARDIVRNGFSMFKSRRRSASCILYMSFSVSALLLGLVSNIITAFGFSTWYGQAQHGTGNEYQWKAVISIIGYFLPVYVTITIRDYVLICRSSKNT